MNNVSCMIDVLPDSIPILLAFLSNRRNNKLFLYKYCIHSVWNLKDKYWPNDNYYIGYWAIPSIHSLVHSNMNQKHHIHHMIYIIFYVRWYNAILSRGWQLKRNQIIICMVTPRKTRYQGNNNHHYPFLAFCFVCWHPLANE